VPTYQYACTACGNELEAVQSFSDEPLTECPECAGRLRKVFSTVGVVFKGSGFYRTDSRSGSGEKSDKGDKGKDAPTKDAPAKETAAKDTSTKESSPAKDTSSTPKSDKAPAST
jgi:putative FmdB family regulatory protein